MVVSSIKRGEREVHGHTFDEFYNVRNGYEWSVYRTWAGKNDCGRKNTQPMTVALAVKRPILLTLPPSHYCERARWALDRQAIVYDEERLAPGAHALRAKRLGASATSLPLLLLGDGSLCQGSDRILDWTGLSSGDPDIERRFEQSTGPLIRQCLYAGLLHEKRSGIRDVLLRGTSRLVH